MSGRQLAELASAGTLNDLDTGDVLYAEVGGNSRQVQKGPLASSGADTGEIFPVILTSQVTGRLPLANLDTGALGDTGPVFPINLDSNEVTGRLPLAHLDTGLGGWAGVSRASGFDTFAATPTLANLGSLLTNEAAGAMTFLTTPTSANLASLVTDDAFSLADAELGAIAGLTSAADKFPYFTGAGAAALADLSSAFRTFLTTPSSANLAALLSDETGSGTAIFSSAVREKLSANRDYYVRSDGSDSNTGLANTSGGAFLTIQKAYDTIVTLDLNGFTATINVGSGTFTSISCAVAPVGGPVILNGNGAANTTLSGAGNRISVTSLMKLTIQNLKVTNTSSGYCVYCDGNGRIVFGSGLEFGAGASGHIRCAVGGIIESSSSYTVSGAAPIHFSAALQGCIIIAGGTITISGTPAFTIFAGAETLGMLFCVATFSGSATGTRYSATLNGVIAVNGAGASYFPGNAGGSTGTGGQYV